MYFPDLKKQVERDYETDLENEAVNEAWTDAINAVAGSLDYQGAYHVWENGYERGDADDDDILADAGLRVLGYNGGHPALNRGAFSNRRCELWWHLRQRFEKERLWLPEKVPETEKLLADLVAPEYELTMAGRIKVETKEKLLERGVPSPDFADSLTLCFASDPNPEEALQEEPEFGRDPVLQEELLPPGGEEEGFEEFSEPIGQFPVGY